MKKLLLLSLLSFSCVPAMAMENDAKRIEPEEEFVPGELLSVKRCLREYETHVDNFIKKQFADWQMTNVFRKKALHKRLRDLKSQVERELNEQKNAQGLVAIEDAMRIFENTLHQARTAPLHHVGALQDTPYDYETYEVRNENGTYNGKTIGLWADQHSQESYNVNWTSDSSGFLISE